MAIERTREYVFLASKLYVSLHSHISTGTHILARIGIARIFNWGGGLSHLCENKKHLLLMTSQCLHNTNYNARYLYELQEINTHHVTR